MSHRQSINLKSQRKRSGFTQEELGFLLGLKDATAVCRFETGERQPGLELAFDYHALFGRELSSLFPQLAETARERVRARARELSGKLSKDSGDRRTAYKLKQLARLGQEVMPQALAV